MSSFPDHNVPITTKRYDNDQQPSEANVYWSIARVHNRKNDRQTEIQFE
jgi:hypothetical protein